MTSSAAPVSNTYKYGEDFQVRILSVMAKDPGFMSVHRDAVKITYFEKPEYMTTAKLLLNYGNLYNSPPDMTSCMAMAEDAINQYHVPAPLSDNIRRTVAYIYQLVVEDVEFITDRVLDFARRQEMKSAISKQLDLLDKPDADLNEARRYVDDALMVGLNKNPGMDLGAMSRDIPLLLAESPTYSRRIPTCLPTLDRCMMGGLGYGEFGVVVGPAGLGKSTTLANLGYGCFISGHNVAHITLELKEIDVALKYVARHTGMDMNEIVGKNPDYLQKLAQQAIPAERIKIKYYSPATCDANTVRGYMSYLHSQGFHPDILIIDYIKKMKFGRGNSYEALGTLSDQLIAIGDDFKCGVWTAQQTRRAQRYADITELESISDAWSLIENADIGLALSQTKLEHKANRLRLEVGKVRRGSDLWTIACSMNYGKATIAEMTPEQLAAERDQINGVSSENTGDASNAS